MIPKRTRERRNPTPTNNPFAVLQPDSEVRPRVLQEEGPQEEEEEIVFEQDTLHHTTESSENSTSESETKTENEET